MWEKKRKTTTTSTHKKTFCFGLIAACVYTNFICGWISKTNKNAIGKNEKQGKCKAKGKPASEAAGTQPEQFPSFLFTRAVSNKSVKLFQKSTNRSVNSSNHQWINQSTNKQNNWPTLEFIYPFTHQSDNEPMNQSNNQPINEKNVQITILCKKRSAFCIQGTLIQRNIEGRYRQT